MKRCNHGLLRRCLLLAGCGALLAGAQVLCGGQPIQFSEPKKEVDSPARKQPPVSVPRTPLKWNLQSPDSWAPPPPPVVIVDPRAEKLLRERREQNKTWPFNEPSLFKDTLSDPSEQARAPLDEALKTWEGNIERVFGKDAGADPKKKEMNRPNPMFFSDQPLFETTQKGSDQAVAASLVNPEPGKPDPLKNSGESAMKALFDPRPSTEKMPVLPGMSLYEMLGSANVTAKALKHAQEKRREEFNRLLTPQEPPATVAAEGPGAAADQTRSLINPVAPATLNNALPSKNPLEPILPPSLADKFPQPKLPFEELKARYQTPVAAKPPENKAQQMEALRLMTRPSVLAFPGRSF